MAAFSPKSRYVLHASTEKATDRKRREVVALTPAEVPVQVVLGEHLAHHYLKDATSFWRIAEANGALLPDALAEATRLIIPARGR